MVYDTLIGYTHGDKEKLSELGYIMANEQPKLWADAKHKLFRIGHRHRQATTTFKGSVELKGVTVEEVGSLSGTDLWHNDQGYIGSEKSASAMIINKANGPYLRINFLDT